MNNFHEFYIDLKESDILHLQDGIDEERNSFKNISNFLKFLILKIKFF